MDEQSCKCHCHNNHGLPPGSDVRCRCIPNCEHCNPYYQQNVASEVQYNVVIPATLYRELSTLALEQNMDVTGLVKRCMKIGLIVAKSAQETDTSFIIRQGEREREIIFT